MADLATNNATVEIRNPFKAVGTSILNFMVRIAESNSRVREMERLSALSDEALKQRGLTRADIVRHVFRDVYYV